MLWRSFVSSPFGQTKEEFEDTKGIIGIHKSKSNRQHNGQKKKYKRKTIVPTKHYTDKLKIEQHEPH